MPKIELIQGDCLIEMPKLADKSIDAVICDLPYGITNCKWDSVIPFEPMWAELKRIIKPNGAICLFGSQPFTSALVMSNPKMFRYEWVWIKNRSGGAVTKDNKPLSCVEDILVFYRGQSTYNPQMEERTEEELKRLSQNSVCKNSDNNGVGFQNSYTQKRANLKKKYPRRDLYFKTVFNRSKEKVSHPTQKPVALMEYLIKTYTNEGETVLDFCAGSGTTGVAAKNLNRNFIGIELSSEYYAIARNRIENS